MSDVDDRIRGGLSRRQVLKLGLGGAAWLTFGGCGSNIKSTGRRVIALGLDGMDPQIVHRMMKAGQLPNFAKVARQGTFGALGTSDPPQSPVAWANFITGCNPGTHGIFDFVHRDPGTLFPYLSTSRAEPPEKTLKLGDLVIPLGSGTVENLRGGRALWEVLEEQGVPATIFRIPSNFPPTQCGQRTISGMGTPDILGTYGMFSYYSDQPVELDETLGGGHVYRVDVKDHVVRAHLAGPPNTFRKGGPETRVEFTVARDPRNDAARISVQGSDVLLSRGEWSPWVRVSFHMVAGLDVDGMCRFYLRQAHPHFQLYVTAINIDPSSPSMPISTPESYSKELYDQVGLFHTKGLPADTKALDQGVLDDGEFLSQDDLFLEENLALYDYELSRFQEGLLFYYISSTDQRAHMFYRYRDPTHPAYDEKKARQYGDTIEKVYLRMDRMLQKTLEKVDDRTTLVAFSDHGFAPYMRAFHLNTWLRNHGYLVTKGGGGEKDIFSGVDWSATRAYAVGFNSLYVNEKGREVHGCVDASEKRALVEEIATGLAREKDPKTGDRVVAGARRTSHCYSGARSDQAPEIIVGYNRGYRASWQTALGVIPDEMYSINDKKWSGDHCMDSSVVPGTFLTNRKCRRSRDVALTDMTATILDACGVEVPEDLDGKSML